MAKPPIFPVEIRNQSTVVKIYRQMIARSPLKDGRARSASNYAFYAVAWVGATGRDRKGFTDFDEAKDFAEIKAAQLAKGHDEALHLTQGDAVELAEARAIAGDVPLISALREWKLARELTQGAVREACEAWAAGRKTELKRVSVKKVIEDFIAAKKKLGKKERTYRSKLAPAAEHFGEVFLDTIETPQWTAFLGQFDDEVTRNDYRKRAITLCRWAQAQGHLPDDRIPNIERTERSLEKKTRIGILIPKVYAELLEFFRANHPELLAAVVLAGFAGLRSDEIHGKRDEEEPTGVAPELARMRQLWTDVHLEEGFLNVTNAKTNTPADRVVHLTPNAIEWLTLARKADGYVCERFDMQLVRRLAIAAGFKLPENCFRHSFITYRIASTGDKPTTATEAGNSVQEIDRRYRVPQPKPMGDQWFAIRPKRLD